MACGERKALIFWESTEANASKEATSGYLTPRPDWGAIDDRGFTKGASKTRDKAAALAKSAKALQSDYTELQKVKAELSAQMDETIELISGERGPLRVNVNELLRDAGGGSAMLTLGTHAEVPRYLRCDASISLTFFSLLAN